ncbi:MAG: glycosyltransferase family 4 protein [Planctomycetota bacterium]|jgi:glycosyltransferase involved in cell wall biosynthesis
MRVLALIEREDHVCYRYRIKAYAPALAQRGIEIAALPIQRNTFRRIRQFRAAREADVVILQRRLLPLWQVCLLRRAARCLIYDVDDAVYQRDSFHRKPPTSRRRLARFWATVYAADAVTAGNEYLAQRAAAYTERDRVSVIPTCVDPSRYSTARHDRAGAGVQLAWIGQRSTLPSLACARRHLAASFDAVPGLRLRVISDEFPQLEGVRVAPTPWASATETADLAEADIGICWLPDDRWSRGKCGLKVLQYMAAGLPVVANPVGMTSRLVVHGRTGFLAESPLEWAEGVRRLAEDPHLRKEMGDAGRRLVEERFSTTRWGPDLAAVIHRASFRAADRDAGKTTPLPQALNAGPHR